jgi:hypothetical protein
VIHPVVETCWDESFVFVLSCEVLDVLPPAAILYEDIIRERRVEERVWLVVTGLQGSFVSLGLTQTHSRGVRLLYREHASFGTERTQHTSQDDAISRTEQRSVHMDNADYSVFSRSAALVSLY